MAATVAFDAQPQGREAGGSSFIRRGTIQVGVYATNGVAVTKSTFDLWGSLDELNLTPSAGYVAEWDKTNAKIKVYDQKDPAAAGGADIALPEVANAVDLSAVLFRFTAKGK